MIILIQYCICLGNIFLKINPWRSNSNPFATHSRHGNSWLYPIASNRRWKTNTIFAKAFTNQHHQHHDSNNHNGDKTSNNHHHHPHPLGPGNGIYQQTFKIQRLFHHSCLWGTPRVCPFTCSSQSTISYHHSWTSIIQLNWTIIIPLGPGHRIDWTIIQLNHQRPLDPG